MPGQQVDGRVPHQRGEVRVGQARGAQARDERPGRREAMGCKARATAATVPAAAIASCHGQLL